MGDVVIEVKNLEVWYKSFHAVKNVSLGLLRNHITAFIGASGSGKSTLLRSLNRMLDTIPHARAEGEISFSGIKNILDPSTDVIALRRRIGMVFQNPVPFPKSIYDNVAYGLQIQGQSSDSAIRQAVTRSLQEAALWEEVKDRLHRSAYGLSGGQQQRLCIARAIAVRPEVLLLDEPCSELDPISTHKIEQLLLALKSKYTIVIVTHNMHQARRISDTLMFFHMGELVESGPTAALFETPTQALTRDYVQGNFG